MKKLSFSTWLSAAILLVILLGCAFSAWFIPYSPEYMDLESCSLAPCASHPFGTDSLGRDVFSMVFHGGRLSLGVGLLSTALSTLIAVVYGTVSGLAPNWLDRVMMRAVELFLSVPSLLLILFLQAIFGNATVWSLSLVIGVTSWTAIAKVVRTEVRRMRSQDYIIASRSLGTGFLRMLFRHYLPGFLPSILFMVVMNIRSAMAAEATLSFLGLGFPPEVISWGSMLSLAQSAVLTGCWWILLIPGAFLIVTLLCITSLGNALRRIIDQRMSLL